MSDDIIDISPVVSPRIAVWPGDVAFRRTVALSIAAGDNLELSSVETTLHVGAHADAPSHYLLGAPGIGERSLDLYVGPCQVIAVDVPRGERIRPNHLPRGLRITSPRVLFKTGSFPDPERFNEDFVALSPELVHLVAAEGGRLVGIDTPSIDPCHDKELRSHAAVAAHDMAVLEGLVLDHVEPGAYTLIALPLRLAGADASPVRAVLLRDEA
ncbi:MAG: kynurenine formamidase [Myxococcales bacterium]